MYYKKFILLSSLICVSTLAIAETGPYKKHYLNGNANEAYLTFTKKFTTNNCNDFYPESDVSEIKSSNVNESSFFIDLGYIKTEVGCSNSPLKTVLLKNEIALTTKNKFGYIIYPSEYVLKEKYIQYLTIQSKQVILGTDENKKVGILDSNKDKFISEKYDFISVCLDNPAILSAKINNNSGEKRQEHLLNYDGTKFINETFDFTSCSFEKAPEETISNFIIVHKNGKKFFVNEKGQYLTDISFENAMNFDSGIAFVKNNKKWAILNGQGTLLTDYEFDDVTFIKHNVFVAKKGKFYNFYNLQGQNLSKYNFYEIDYSWTSKIAWVRLTQNSNYKLFDVHNDKFLNETEFLDISSFNKYDMAVVSKGDLKGIIHISGKMLLEPKAYDNIEFDEDTNTVHLIIYDKKHEIIDVEKLVQNKSE